MEPISSTFGLQVRNEILEQADEYRAILTQTGYRNVDSYSALAAKSIAADDLGPPHMFKEMKTAGMKSKKFFSTKKNIIKHLNQNGYPELRKKNIQPLQLVDRFCRELNMTDTDIEKIHKAIQHIENSMDLALALSEHANTQVAALILMATAQNNIETVSNVTHVRKESIQKLLNKLKNHANQLFPGGDPRESPLAG